jgi:hypothetical protein
MNFGYPVQTEAYLEAFHFAFRNDWQVSYSKYSKYDVKLSVCKLHLNEHKVKKWSFHILTFNSCYELLFNENCSKQQPLDRFKFMDTLHMFHLWVILESALDIIPIEIHASM